MKKLILPLLALTMMLAPKKSNAQAIEEGNVIIDAYYGFPNLYSTVFKAAYESSNSTGELTLGSQGPLGIRAEYLITDKVGLGIDLGMNSSSMSYSEADINNPNIIYDYKFTTRKIGAIFTFNYHFVENDKLDAYFVVGGGYGNRNFKFTSSDPNYDGESAESIIPISYKIGVGMRYFFTENIGTNLALGLGQGGLANVGVSAKF